MSDPKVRDLFPQTPFEIGGGLNRETGRELFTPLEMHEKFRDEVIKNRRRGTCIWALSGPVGIGRTWTLCWTARQAVEQNMGTDERWEAALVPGLGSGQIRDLYESVFQSTDYLREEAAENLDQGFDHISGQGREGILNHALTNQSSWSVFTGDRGRFPNIDGIDQKPKWTKRETQVQFLILWLKKLKEIGVDNLLILVDEFETTVTRLSSSKMTDFSDGLRRFYDVIEENKDDIPNVEIILSATTEAANKIDPSASSSQLQGWLTALQSRMTRGFRLGKISEDEAKKIAINCIDYRRTVDSEDEYYPYTVEAIETAYDGSDGLTRRLGEIINEMYFTAFDKTLIEEEDAQEAVEILGYDFKQIN
ncbi:hypothetical protein N0B31_02685 [Salinirubellus salinus]|uniref:ATP-binding protein n=1 Tax=Salinirubellus salinus TaxID=1364945 RepID=A0A9E7R406_9EURY|nr:hypothetical protein [Salinirubellus salinus]UWM55197.1 hypothetical protein N0B31_02685 [Salinirubellus salinus]